jgi:DNA ligase (NAD+)
MTQELRNKIIEANKAYRLGKPIMSDAKYDLLIEELSILSPDDEILTQVGHTISDETRKALLPIEMASMDKLKTIEEISDWCRLKGIGTSELVIITPKLDGLSLCVEEDTENVWTRGDGVYGQKSNEHYKLIKNHKKANSFDYTYGEVIMSKKSFLDKYSEEFANPRNLVAGLLNSKEIKDSLTDCNYIRYGGVGGDFTTKKEVLDELNKFQTVKINYHVCKITDLTEELLIDLFHKWSVDYEIDGVIIEVNNLELQEELGRETSSKNPVWARAFKHESFTQAAETEVVGISWNISKQGYLKPTLHVRPIKLDGVTVSNVTGNNARFVKDTG